jgi:hypothetical protein
MSHDFGNNAYNGYQAKSYEYKPTWEKDVDYNPDHQPSSSASYYEDRGADVLFVMQVKGLGVVTMRATSSWGNPAGKLRFDGVGIFTKADIGYSPNI